MIVKVLIIYSQNRTVTVDLKVQIYEQIIPFFVKYNMIAMKLNFRNTSNIRAMYTNSYLAKISKKNLCSFIKAHLPAHGYIKIRKNLRNPPHMIMIID